MAEINDKIKGFMESKRIVKGRIVKISNLNIVVSLNIDTDDELIYIPREESNLYVPRVARTDKEKMLFVQRCVGKKISFIITGHGERDGKEMAIGSMKKAAQQYFKYVRKVGLENIEPVVNVNVIAAGTKFAVVEYNGYVATVSDREISYSEVNSVSVYLRENKYRDFEINRLDPYQEYMEFSRKDVQGDIFMKRVIEEKAYRVDDVVMGEIIGTTNDNRLLIQLEKEVLGIAHYPEFRIKISGRVSATITGINKGKRKLFLSNIAVV